MTKLVKYRGLKYVIANDETQAKRIELAKEDLRKAKELVNMARGRVITAYQKGQSKTWSNQKYSEFVQSAVDAMEAIRKTETGAEWLASALRRASQE